MIGRCLAKDPARRYQSIKDLAIEVDDLRQVVDSTTGAHLWAETQSLSIFEILLP